MTSDKYENEVLNVYTNYFFMPGCLLNISVLSAKSSLDIINIKTAVYP